MKILERRVYRGPNLYALFPVIRLTARSRRARGSGRARSSARLQRRAARDVCPASHQHACSYGEPGGFVRRLTRGRGHLARPRARARRDRAAEPRRRAGHLRQDARRRRARPVPRGLRVRGGAVGEAAAARRCGCSIICCRPSCAQPRRDDEPFDFAAPARDRFIRFAQRRAARPVDRLAGARRRGARHPVDAAQRLQPGPVRPRQATRSASRRRSPARPAHIAVEIASDKEETNRILGDLGLPVPRAALVVRTAEDAAAAAERLGYPGRRQAARRQSRPRRLASDLTDEEQVRAAFARRASTPRSVIVESFLDGPRPPHAGRRRRADRRRQARARPRRRRRRAHRSRELVDIVNQRSAPRHRPREGAHAPRVRRPGRAPAGARRATTSDTVPAAGEIVLPARHRQPLDRRHGDRRHRRRPPRQPRDGGPRREGHRPRRRRRRLHHPRHQPQSYRRSAAASARSTPRPASACTSRPREGKPRDVAGPVIDMLFPPGTPCAHPDRRDHRHQRQDHDRAHARAHPQDGRPHASASPPPTASTSTASAPSTGDMTGPQSPRRWSCAIPPSTLAVLETARGGLLRARHGLPARATSAPCSTSPRDHLGLQRHRHARAARRGQAHRRRGRARLRRAQRRRRAAACRWPTHTKAARICYVTMNPRHELVREHIRAGGRAVVLEEGINGQHDHALRQRRAHPAAVDAPDPGDARGQGACTTCRTRCSPRPIAYAMGMKLENIRQGLRTFDTTFFQAPGRMNVFDEHPVQGHPRLRPQPGRGAGDVPTRRSASTCSGRRIVRARRAGRPPRRGHRRDRARSRRGAVRPLSSCARDDNPRGRGRDEVPQHDGGRAAGAAASPRRADRRSSPTSRRPSHAALAMAAPGRPAADLRRQRHALLEADHLLRPRPVGRRRRDRPRPSRCRQTICRRSRIWASCRWAPP